MRENIKLSFQGIWSHKMRSILTMLGIIIGIASIIAIVSTIKGNSELIKESLIGSNTNVVTVKLYQGDSEYDMSYQNNPEGILPLSDEDAQQLRDQDSVEEISLYNSRDYANESVYYQNVSFSGSIYGIDENYLDVYGYHLDAGRLFVERDYTDFRKVVLIDSTVASSMFSGQNPLGKVFEINGDPFTIVGIISQDSSTTLNIESVSDYYTYMDTSSGRIFVPDVVWPIVGRFDEIQSVAVKATSTDDMTAAGKNVENALNDIYNLSSETDYVFKSENLLEQAEKLQAMSNSTNQQLIWIAGISLLVGGIGVMNIMLVTVTERTQEIGLKKALGAKKRVILGQFLTEAAVLTSIGGILGVLFGILVANVLSAVMGIPTAISVPAMMIAVLFSIFIGLLFGYLPARKAANLNPIDALRTE